MITQYKVPLFFGSSDFSIGAFYSFSLIWRLLYYFGSVDERQLHIPLPGWEGTEGRVMCTAAYFHFNPFSRYTNNMKCKKCGSKIKLVFS
jgi:hypothetical protein